MENTRKTAAVLAAVDDMFFSTKIESAARALGIELVQALNAAQLTDRLAGDCPGLIIIDLNSKACSPLQAIRKIKADPKFQEIPMIAFFSHVQVELERAAREAGCDRVMPRSVFSSTLPQILQMAASGSGTASGHAKSPGFSPGE